MFCLIYVYLYTYNLLRKLCIIIDYLTQTPVYKNNFALSIEFLLMKFHS